MTASVRELLPGVWLVHTPMPGHSFGGLNSYLLQDGDGAILVDTPWGTDDVIEAVVDGVRATGTDPADVRQVIATHYHEDHAGAAGWWQQRYGSTVALHPADAAAITGRHPGTGSADPVAEFEQVLETWISRTGVGEPSAQYARRQYRTLAAFQTPLQPVRLIDDGDVLRQGELALRVLHTPGHTPGHVCLHDERRGLLFTGDHVFAHRRSNATARPYHAHRPIADWWRSSERLLATGATTVLPGHEEPFTDLGTRLDHLAAVRDAKLAELPGLCARPSTAWEIAARVRRRTAWSDLDPNALLAATGETLAYLLHASDSGAVRSDAGVPQRWHATDPSLLQS